MTRFLIACEISLVEELWNYFVDKLFAQDLPYYENFSIQSNSLFSLRGLILGITVGIVIAALSTLYSKRYLGGFVRYLISLGSLDRESAVTLDTLNKKTGFGIRRALKTGGSLHRWVNCVEEDEFNEALDKARAEHEEKHLDDAKAPRFKELSFKRRVNSMRFYVSEDKRAEAEAKFNPDGANLKGILIVVGITVAFGLALCYLLPDALVYLDGFMTLINGL